MMPIAAESAVRLAAFLCVFLAMAVWEAAAPRRRREIPRWLRWTNNLALVAVDTVLVRMAFPVAAVGFALLAEQRGWGLFNSAPVADWAAFVLSLLALDLSIYFQHRLFHAVPVLWRLHRVHHADLEIDVTTGVRFHPLEMVLSMAIKLAAVAALGAPALAVLGFEVLLNATSMFNHANIRMPLALDRAMRWIVVTPDMHRVHHSIRPEETNSNFGFNQPWWDRLFQTYRSQPAAGHEAMVIGLDRFRTRRDLWIDRMLLQPVRRGCARGGPRPATEP
jgi:sterol desaturase/sphingolipid hydroxylase (fatty acid hydroxylase superfamily)